MSDPLVKCEFCEKKYVGETTNAFRNRWSNYKDNEKKFQGNENCIQKHLYKHCFSEGHNGFLGNVSESLMDKTDGFRPKKRENYWMRALKILGPLGLNAESTI